VLLFSSSSLCAEIHKWVDENGKVQFSDRKQQGKQQEGVVVGTVASSWSRFDIDVTAIDVELTGAEHQLIVDGVNHVYEFFDRVLFFDMYKTVPVNILILKDRAAYRQTTPRQRDAFLGDRARGYPTIGIRGFLKKLRKSLRPMRMKRSGEMPCTYKLI